MEAKKTIIMYFHCAGVISNTEENVVSEDEKYIHVDRDGYGKVWTFIKKTGKCINDENAFGCYRTIVPIINQQKH